MDKPIAEKAPSRKAGDLAPDANALAMAHSVLWHVAIGVGGGRRRLQTEPALILTQETRCSDSEADSLVGWLEAAGLLRRRQDTWEVVGGTESDDESDQEFLRLRDRYTWQVKRPGDLERFIGVSESVSEVRKRIALAAKDEELVLVTGESGVGKGIVAHLVHELSARCDEPFIHVNCASLPAGVLESELFGHEKGAFTSAHKVRKGCFERAGRGTLFLDEIGEITLEFQSKLLQVLEEGIFFRVGGEQELQSTSRVIVATNKNLTKAVVKKEFRLDLFFRIYGMPIHIPALRERRDDISHLIAHYAAILTQKDGRKYRLAQDASKLLSAHKWPGNVRELQTVMRIARRLSNSGLVTAQHIQFPTLEGLLE